MENLYMSNNGNVVKKIKNNIILKFKEPMICLSTSQLNGGIRELQSCFNHQLDSWINTVDDLPGKSMAGYFKKVAGTLNLDWHNSSGLMTTASMDNAALEWLSHEDLSLFVLVTAGAGVNAMRSGDPPSYYEKAYNSFVPISGTINTFLVIEAPLPLEALTRTAIIVTEAKTAALQDMGIKSCFSSKIATGTGTDGLIVACNKTGPLKYTDVGNHSQLGYMISTVVQRAIKLSLKLEIASFRKSEQLKNLKERG